MCGIAGVIGMFPKERGTEIVKRMNNAIVHRGPDDDGVWSTDGFAFGMRRLSIIDLSGGHQPMWTKDGVGIVFNGEIYNYRELRKELEACGYRFRTNSDTEVILNLYHSSGVEGIKRMEGMFGICIFDPRQNVAYLFRDRIGIKPLYYGFVGGQFYFASEIKGILAGAGSVPKLNHQALYHYLTLRYVPSPETVWEDIFKLEPGHYIAYSIAEQKWSISRYWQMRFNSRPLEPGRDYLQEFEELFLESVEKHLVASDVPVGVLLSGGLDSSAVSAAAVELGHRNFHTFSVAFDDGGEFSELKYAREMANNIGSQHHEVVIGQKEFLSFIPEFVRFSDEPLADLASIPLYYVSRLSRDYVKVVLTGEGSDEIFAGYDIEVLARRLEFLRSYVDWIPRPGKKLLCSLIPSRKAQILKSLYKSGWSGCLREQCSHITKYWSEEEKLLLWGGVNNMESTHELIRSWYNMSDSGHPVDQLQQVYCHSWLVEDLLMKADKMSMASSLELRVPFLHHPLVEWTCMLPMAWKVGDKRSGYVSKRILRDFCKKRVPESIINRPKQGFPVPAYEWLKGDLGLWAEKCLIHESRFLKDMFDLSYLGPVLTAARNGNYHSAHKVWGLVILEYWGRHWVN